MSLIFQSKKHFHDVLIIGAGGSGLATAIFLASKGLNIAIASKVHPLKSHTVAAQGGINAALGNVTSDDIKWHIYDTIKAADGLADEDSVEYMCKQAPKIIKLLEDLGVEFDRRKDGRIDQKIYGGQSTNFGKGDFAYRACYSKDRTGHSIMHKLYERAISLGVIFYDYNFALDLIYKDNQSFGANFWDIENGLVNSIFAPNTIVATGGYTQIYDTTTSAKICTGDGIALAARAGVGLQDMEFIQFHPTAINKIGVLITEASRSAGGKLINGKGERFMGKYDPKFMELSTRDIVSRAIATEINIGNGAGKNQDHVWLDLTHLTNQQIKDILPTVYENATSFANIDPSKAPIPISPAAHYNMGGIPTNSNCQVVKYQSSEVIFTGLYAVGEAASISVHGAGRLGCNSLLDLLVFAKKLANTIDKDNNKTKWAKHDLPNYTEYLIKQNDIASNYSTAQLLDNLKKTMQKNVGIFRSKYSLQEAQKELIKLENNFQKLTIKDKSLSWNLELQNYLELKNMLICASATTYSAIWRTESRGVHWRVDYPAKNNQFLLHSICNIANNIAKILPRKVRKN